ncbi:MAG TPA: hypothetical protein VF263_02505, partial [Longimicrobiaceae bacterium]
MLQNLKVRILLIVAVIAAAGALLATRGITRGLDLQGGSHFAMEIDESRIKLNSEQRADAIDRALKVVRTRVDAMGVAEPVVQKAGESRIIVELPGLGSQTRAKEVLQKTAFLQFQLLRPTADLQPALAQIDRAVAAAFPAAGGAAPAQAPAGGLFKTQPGAADSLPTSTPFSSKLAPAGDGVFTVAPADAKTVERYLANPSVRRLLPRGTELLWGMPDREAPADAPRLLYLVEQRAMMTGEHLEKAQAQSDPTSMQPTVRFDLSRRGGRIFEKATGENIGRYMAIVLDDRVYSAPVIQSQIGNSGQIELGGSTLDEASDLALVLRAGALPAVQRLLPRGTEFLWGTPEPGVEQQNQQVRRLLLVESRPMMTGEYLEQAQAQTDQQTMRPIVVFELSRRGGRIFERATGENIGKQMAIVLDDR